MRGVVPTAAALMLVLSSSAARADEQELALDAELSAEGAVLTNPFEGPVSLKPLLVGRPRLSLGMRYDVLDSLYVGVHSTVAGSLSPSLDPVVVVTPDVQIDRFTGELHSSQGTGALLFSTGYRLDLGWDYTVFFEGQAGPALTFWYHHQLAVPRVNPTEQQFAYIQAPDIPFTLLPGVIIKLQAGFQARLFNNLLVVVMPYLTGGWVGGVDLGAGLAVRASWVLTPWLH